MKSVIKILGIVALAATVVFAITACDSSGSGDGKGGNGTLPQAGDGSISFASAKEYPVYRYSDPNTSYIGADIIFTKIWGETVSGDEDRVLDISSFVENLAEWDIKVDGTISKLSLKLGVPQTSELVNASESVYFAYPGLSHTSGLNVLVTEGEFFHDAEDISVLWVSSEGTPAHIIYADRDGTISGATEMKGTPVLVNLALKQGWNTTIILNENTPAWITGTPDSSYKWVVLTRSEDWEDWP